MRQQCAKLLTNQTQLLHRIRLKKFIPNKPITDSFQNEELQADDDIILPQDDLYTLAWETDLGIQLSEQSDTVSTPVSVRPQAHENETADEADTTRKCVDSNPNNPNKSGVNDESARRNATNHNDVTPTVPSSSEQRQMYKNTLIADENKNGKLKESHSKETS